MTFDIDPRLTVAIIEPLLDLVVRTKTGTVLTRATRENLSTQLDSWLFYRRTGVMTMNEPRIIISWNTIALVAGVELKPDLGSKDKQKLIDLVEANLENFTAVKKAGGSNRPRVDTAFAIMAPKVMDQVFTSLGTQEMPFGSFAGMFYVSMPEPKKGDTKPSLQTVTDNLRSMIKLHPDKWSMGQGGNPAVRKLGGKVKAFENTRTVNPNSKATAKGLLRQSPATIETWELLSLPMNGEEPQENAWDNWVAYCATHKLTDPGKVDMKKFADNTHA